MKVATRLRAAFALYIALLAAVVIYHVRTIQRAVASGHALTEISTRLRVTATDQVGRIAQMNSDAEKFLVTHDRGYLRKVLETASAFGDQLSTLDSLSLTPAERAALKPLAADWKTAAERLPRLASLPYSSDAAGRATTTRFQQSLEHIRIATEALGAAAQQAMARELSASESSARSAERVSWVAAFGAIVLSLALSAMLVRSIVGPLQRLAEGTREVSAGRFGHRLETSGGDEFAQVSRDFNSMTARLDELDKMKQDFVAKVSHDLKTPLSSMQETIRVLLDGLAGPVSPKQRQLLELNLESGRRLSGMLTKLLDLSRIEAGLEPDLELLDLVAIAKQAVDRASTGGEGTPRVTFMDRPTRVLVRADAAGLAQVVDNLIENAIKFSPPTGTVVVRVNDSPEESQRLRRGTQGTPVTLTVADEGPGVPDADRERIFERFYQTEAGRQVRGRGVGLGLTICREIMQAHGGALWVTGNTPRGSVFHVLLPGLVYAANGAAPTGATPGADADTPATGQAAVA